MTRLGIWLLPFFAIVLLQEAVGQQTPSFWRGQDSVRLTEVFDWLQKTPNCRCTFNGARDEWRKIKVPIAQLKSLNRYHQLGDLSDTLDYLLLNTGYTAELLPANGGHRSVNLYLDDHDGFLMQGQVLNAATGEGAERVLVGAHRSGQATYSDEHGHFTLLVKDKDRIVLGGSYRYVRQEIDIAREALQHGPLLVYLVERSSSTSPIDITDDTGNLTQLDLGLSTTVHFDPEKVARMPGVGAGDFMQLASSLPGVSSTESAGELSIRGGNIDQNLYRLDGISLRQPQHFLGGLSLFNPQAMRDHEITYVGFGPAHGRRVSGVVLAKGRSGLEGDHGGRPRGGLGFNLLNLQAYAEAPMLQRNRNLDLGVHVSGRSSLSMLTPAAGSSPLYQRLIDNRFQATDPALRRLTQTGPQVQLQPHNRFYDFNAKAELRIERDDRLELTFFRGVDWLNYTEGIPDRAAFYSDSLRTENSGVSLAWLRDWRLRGTDRWLWPKSKTHLAYSEFQNDYAYRLNQVDLPSFLRQDHRLTELSLHHTTSWVIDQRSEIEGGIEWSRLQQQSGLNHVLAGYQVDSLHTAQEAGILSQFVNYTFSYPENAATESGFFRIALGMRHTYYTPNQQHYWEPRTSATYVFNPQWHLRASWGRYLQYSTLALADNRLNAGENMFVLAEGDSIDVVQAYHFNVGIFHKTRFWEFTLDAYRKDLRGLSMYHFGGVEVLAEQEPDALLTGGEGLAQGLEFMGKFDYARHGFSGLVSYSLAQVQHQFSELNEGGDFDAPQDQRHRITVLGQYELGTRWFFALRWDFASGLPFTPVEDFSSIPFPGGDQGNYLNTIAYGPINSQRLPAYHRLDFSCQYEFPLDAISAPGQGPVSGALGINLVNVYDQDNVSRRRYRVLPGDATQSGEAELLTVDYRMLGLLPNVFVKLDF